MRRNMAGAAGRVALCGMLAALSVACLLLSWLIPVGSYAFPALAGALLIPVVIEMGAASGVMTYAAVAVLTLLLVPDMETKLLFVAFFGYYPIVKSPIERTLARGRRRVAEWLLKLAIFNASMVAAYLLLIKAFNLSVEQFVIGGVNMMWAFLLVGNLVFVIYDLALTRALTAYIVRLHPRVSRLFKR